MHATTRRIFLAGSIGTVAVSSLASVEQAFAARDDIIDFKPHHYIALFRDLGDGSDPTRYTSGNDYERAFHMVMNSHDLKVRLTMGTDFICKPCSSLVDGKCSISISGHGPDQPLYSWAKKVDGKLLRVMKLDEGTVMTSRELAELCRVRLGNLSAVFDEEAVSYTHLRAHET